MRTLVKSSGVAVLGAALAMASAVLATPASASDVGITAYTPEGLCGSGYTRAGSHALPGATVWLMRASSNRKCVVTIKTASVGTETWTGAAVGSAVDRGYYRYYAGPVKQQVRCAYWGGSHGSTTWVSPTQYCN
ncbi:serine/threonine protein kinase [Lentzea cavernae]|uniref:Serine/threonine protein kinase n=1 Tax=Lentzea cavernae TaxID=2020703 RepID=A0ABQ3MQ10_9PSEU|nr:serine/threonine protein kinase [Lentzea cavernae]GHH42799.1 hypothetical protein GCM10017774_39740 [Lentzea cavernae]